MSSAIAGLVTTLATGSSIDGFRCAPCFKLVILSLFVNVYIFFQMAVMPDNIRRNHRGTYWIAGANPPTLLVKLLVRSPALRQAIAGFFPKTLIR